MGVGRRDFELGSAPVFPVVRVEIDLEEWHTQRSACPTLSYTQFTKKKKKKVSLTFPSPPSLFVGELRQTDVLCHGLEDLLGF